MALLLPRAVLHLWFVWSDAYPYNYRDAKILHTLRAQEEKGYIDLNEATPFDWDVAYYLSDIPLQESIPHIQTALEVDLRGIRKIRYEPFDLPAGQCLLFMKEGRLVANFMFPLSFTLPITTTAVLQERQYIEIARITPEEARLAPSKTEKLRWKGDAYA